MFPGNQLLLLTEGVKVLATDEAVKDVEDGVRGELHWLDRGARSVESTIEHRYGSDPMVMKLLGLYLDAVAHVDDSETTVDNLNDNLLKPWPAK